jgi:hypothetical protein
MDSDYAFDILKPFAIVACASSMWDRLQWPKVWRYQRSNHSPYIEGHTPRLKTWRYQSSNFWPLQSVLRYTDYDYSFGIFKPLASVICPSTMYGFWLPHWYLQTFGHWIIIRTSKRNSVQWPKVWRYHRGNQKPHIVERQTTMAKGLKIPKE